MNSLPAHRWPPKRVLHAVQTLVLGSAICTALLVARWIMVGHINQIWLGWNLLLAWIPFVLALALSMAEKQSLAGKLRWWGMAVLWFLFFPNCYYIITDLQHIREMKGAGVPFWFDPLLLAAYALGGVFLGSLSLYLLHWRVKALAGWLHGWLFAGGMLWLSSFGIYLGRFLRLNSWDVFLRPWKLLVEFRRVLSPAEAVNMLGFCATFFGLSFAIYAFVVSMVRLHEVDDQPAP